MQLNMIPSTSTNDVISLQNIEGQSRQIPGIKKLYGASASSQSNVPITGESGTEKNWRPRQSTT